MFNVLIFCKQDRVNAKHKPVVLPLCWKDNRHIFKHVYIGVKVVANGYK